jgi:aryl-alcohol dehydrogenase-like predicted oxidoreductase
MITLRDCIAMCGLDEAEVLAIAEHEHIPEIAATALAQYLLTRGHGAEAIRDMLRDDIRAAFRRHDREHARELFMALRHFLSTHPEAMPRIAEPGKR